MGWGWDMGGGAWWGASLMVLFWIGLIVTVVLVVRAFDRGQDRRGYASGDRHEPGFDACQILDARFARGEISREEYEERSQVLARSH